MDEFKDIDENPTQNQTIKGNNIGINRKTIIIMCIFLLLFLIILAFLLKGSGVEQKKTSNIRLEDDFYSYVNKDILKEKKITMIQWNTFTEVQEKVDDDVEKIIDNILKSNSNTNINNLYENYINKEERNKYGIKILEKYLKNIDSSKDIDELMDNLMVAEEDLAAFVFNNLSVNKDMKDNSKYILTMSPTLICSFYNDKNYYVYEKLDKKYNEKFYVLLGYTKDRAKEVSNNIEKFNERVCNNAMSVEELSKVKNNYNKVSINELNNIFTNVDINEYFKSKGIESVNEINLIDKNYFKNLNAELTSENLQLLKDFIKMQLVTTYSEYLSMDYYELYNEMESEINGYNNPKTLKEESYDYIKEVYSTTVEKKFVSSHFDEKKKEYIESIIKEIVEVYKENLKNNEWLTASTKEKAIEKLDNLKIHVGYPDEYLELEDKYLLKSYKENSSLIENIITINKVNLDYDISLLGTTPKSYWSFPLTEINAYYNPQDNSINFPAAISYLFNEDDSYYKTLGTIGMIIAHEITHAFDSSGSYFDLNGNMNDWWQEDDYKKFEEKTDSVVSYYNKFKSERGYSVNGELTVGENIADLGAINCIVSIAKKRNASIEDYKTLFESYANIWAQVMTKETEQQLILFDTHSPNNVRVNAVLSSNDKFYEIYKIKENDKMFIPKEKRVSVW